MTYNAGLILLCGRNKDRVLLLRDTYTGLWNPPAGRSELVDLKKKNPHFETMKREFIEETGIMLPYLYDIEHIKPYANTTIYVAKTKTILNLPQDGTLRGDGENDRWKLILLQNLMKENKSRKTRLRKCAYEGFMVAYYYGHFKHVKLDNCGW